MRFAGIGWRGDTVVAAIADAEVPGGASTVEFPYAHQTLLAWLAGQREQAGGDLAVAVDSSSGVFESALLASGLPVRRFDPWDLPASLVHGSTDPRVLVEALRSGTGTPVDDPADGWLAGRNDDLIEGARLAAEAEAELVRGGRLISLGPVARREVALTFDDGPDPRYTGQVLDCLDRYGVVATFFCVGLNVRAHPHIVESVAARGHAVANHTWSHPMLPDLSEQNLARQVEATGEAIATVTGAPPRLVRPPYGGRNPAVLQQLTSLGMTTVMWDVDTTDWAQPGVSRIEQAVAERVRPGSVVLMHDSGGPREQTVEALPRVLEYLLDGGYRMVPVEAMLAA